MNLPYIKRSLYCISLGILIFFAAYIAWAAAFNMENADFFSTFLYDYRVLCFLLAGGSVLFFILYALNRLLSGLKGRAEKAVPYVLFCLIILIQLVFILSMRVSLRYDTLKVMDEAVALLGGGTVSPDYSAGYFAKYPNNIPICLFTALLLHIARLFKVPADSYMVFLQIVNILLIDLSLFSSYKLLTRVKSKALGITFLLFALLNPLTYLLTPFYYTATFSMAFSTGALYAFVLFKGTDRLRTKCLLAFLTGALLFTGFKVRATVIILAIGLVIYCLLNIRAWKKQYMYYAAALLCGVLIFFGLYQLLENRYVTFDYRATGYPAAHWIMLGTQGTGGYNAADDAFTEGFATKEKRRSAAVGVIKQRLGDMGPKGILDLGKRKLKITWSDGIDDFVDNVSMTARYGKANDLISGEQNDILAAYCHIYHLMLLLCMFTGILRAFCENHDSLLYPVILNLLGGILFHLLWEAGEVYSISFSCSILLLAVCGFTGAASAWEKISDKKVRFAIPAAGACLALACAVYTGSKLTTVPYTHYEYAMKQDLAEPDMSPSLLEGTEYMQTFKTSRPFNAIGLKVRNPLGAENCSAYQFELLDSHNRVLVKSDIIGAWSFDKDYYKIKFDTITPEADTEYKIRILPAIVSDVHSLAFQSYNTGNVDIYQRGILYINGEATKGDLTFYAFLESEKPFFTAGQ